MRSVSELFNLVQDGKLKTVKEARVIIAEEVEARARATGQSEEEARAILLHNIGYHTGYCDHALADQIMKLYETEHPIFGRTHPTPEEASRLGIEHGKKSLEKRAQDEQQ
jgi:outer membrane phospholipase A